MNQRINSNGFATTPGFRNKTIQDAKKAAVEKKLKEMADALKQEATKPVTQESQSFIYKAEFMPTGKLDVVNSACDFKGTLDNVDAETKALIMKYMEETITTVSNIMTAKQAKIFEIMKKNLGPEFEKEISKVEKAA